MKRPSPISGHGASPQLSRHAEQSALYGAILHVLVANDWIDHAYVDAHTTGFAEAAAAVAQAVAFPFLRQATAGARRFGMAFCDVPADPAQASAAVTRAAVPFPAVSTISSAALNTR